MTAPSHPHAHTITIEPARARVTVTVAGQVIAESENALILHEGRLPDVVYIPRQDAVLAQLARTDHTTHCPFKGDASYFSIVAGGARSENAVWTYEAPLAGVEGIRDHLAFYPDRVDSIDIQPLSA